MKLSSKDYLFFYRIMDTLRCTYEYKMGLSRLPDRFLEWIPQLDETKMGLSSDDLDLLLHIVENLKRSNEDDLANRLLDWIEQHENE